MTRTPKHLKADAMKLGQAERGDHACRRWISMASLEEVAAFWEAEIARRVSHMETGYANWNSVEEVMAELRARIKAAEADADKS